MTAFSNIVPGAVDNGGINDQSIPAYAISIPTAPLHLPVVHVVTPKGKLASQAGTQWIAPGAFKQVFGDIFDEKSPFYNPTSVLISALAAGGQATIGVRRLSANEELSRVAISAYVKKVMIQDYERDSAGRFKYDVDGQRIPVPGVTYQGLEISVQPDADASTTTAGELTVRHITASGEEPEMMIIPLWEGIAGVGDEYNRSGLSMGVRSDPLTWRSISEFVRTTGVFPFDLRQFTDAVNGERVYAKTASRQDTAKFTLFPTEMNKVQYSLKYGFGQFTGTNANRPTTAIPAPFNDLIVYEDNIDMLCQMMYSVEKDVNDSLVEVGGEENFYKQMNPLTCTNHNGAPYYAIAASSAIKWDLSGSVKASGGISPLRGKDGKLPTYVTTPVVNDPFGLLTGVERPISHQQGWEINNKLMVADLTNYVNGPDMKDTTRNKQSVFWDVGYTQEVKELAVQMLGARKDIIVIPCGTVWVPGKPDSAETIYSRAATMTSLLRMTPESEKWGTPSTRASVNLNQLKYINEKTGWYFSGNIDLAAKFAGFAGSASGMISVPMSPDHGDNRIVSLMHSPTVTFEEDDVAAENFNNGHISLRPYDWNDQVYRPGLPTVYTVADSVLKDLLTPFLCVCMEKISAEQWKLVCGDTTITQENYSAIMKDNIERKCRAAVGGMVSQIVAETSFQEGVPGSRAKLSVTLKGWFNKARYMMEFDLFAYNSQDLATAA